MTGYPEKLEKLIFLLKRLPGVGRRGAERLALAMLQWEPEELGELGELIGGLPEQVAPCPRCGAWAGAGELCAVCANPARDAATICVVEGCAQLLSIEGSGHFRGVYHVLGGRISPLDGKYAEDLNSDSLLERVRSGGVSEVILALSSDVEGRATAVYLAEMLEAIPGVRVTRPALGLPAGASFSFADAATISAAFSGRTEVK